MLHESQWLKTRWRETRQIGIGCVALSLVVWNLGALLVRSQEQRWPMNLEPPEHQPKLTSPFLLVA